MIQQYDAPVSWQENAKQRYLGGEWRSPIFKDLVVESLTPDSTVLDIGCGHGFDHDAELQQEISGQCARLIGIEPDPEIAIPSCFDECHIATLKQHHYRTNRSMWLIVRLCWSMWPIRLSSGLPSIVR